MNPSELVARTSELSQGEAYRGPRLAPANITTGRYREGGAVKLAYLGLSGRDVFFVNWVGGRFGILVPMLLLT